MFRLLAQDYKGWGHGLPDLLLWKENGKRCPPALSHAGALHPDPASHWLPEGLAKLVEVKGPRDRLSAYQQVWLDQLLASGLDCEVCYVRELHASKVGGSSSPEGHRKRKREQLKGEIDEHCYSQDQGFSQLQTEEEEDEQIHHPRPTPQPADHEDNSDNLRSTR